MGDELGKDEGDTRDLRHMDKGVHFVAGAWGRPGDKGSETVLWMDGSETGDNGDETGLGWLGMGGDGETLLTCDEGGAGLGWI